MELLRDRILREELEEFVRCVDMFGLARDADGESHHVGARRDRAGRRHGDVPFKVENLVVVAEAPRSVPDHRHMLIDEVGVEVSADPVRRQHVKVVDESPVGDPLNRVDGLLVKDELRPIVAGDRAAKGIDDPPTVPIDQAEGELLILWTRQLAGVLREIIVGPVERWSGEAGLEEHLFRL